MLDPRRRFRDRLLIGMVAVALLPLAGFAILAAVDLDAISRSTANEAQGAILKDEQDRQLTTTQSRAGLLEARLTGVGTELGHLAEQVSPALATAPKAVPSPPTLTSYRGDQFAGTISDPASIVLTRSVRADDLRLVSAGTGLLGAMQALRHDYPEITSVWIASPSGSGLLVVPGIDVRGALDEGLLDPNHPQLRAGTDVLTASERRLGSGGSSAWGGSGARPPGAPFWTDAYALMASGASGVSGWVPLRDGRGTVGVDVAVASLVTAALAQPNAAPFPPAAYPMLLSSDGTVVYADPAAGPDFAATISLAGSPLPASKVAGLRARLGQVEATGRPALLPAKLAGVEKDVFTAPVSGPRWVLASPVPVSDLEPDLSGLTYGIAAGVHTLFPILVLPALLLLLGLAFVAATILSRKLVVPVRKLTEASEVLASGRTDIPVPPQGNDEVGTLASALERMRREINTSREAILAASAELEARVDLRTSELRSRNEELVALNELAGSLTRSLDARVILNEALDAVRAIHPLHAGRGYALDGDALVPVAAWSRDPDATARANALDGIAEQALRRDHPVRRGWRGSVLLGWPLGTRQGVVGALAVDATEPPRGDTRRLLQAVADQVALALRTSLLSAAGREHAVLEERTRLAREIHDTLAQQLTGIVIQLEAAGALVERGSERALHSVAVARELARSALQEARRSVWNLRPAPLAATGVIGAIESEVRGFEERSSIPVRFITRALPQRPPLQPGAEVALLRIAQEALSNVSRHSGATRVDMTLRADGDELALSVRDDGVGFDAAAAAPRDDCFGLEGMRERVELAGGTLVVISSPGHGTEVVARVPLIDAGTVAHSA